jgi:RNA polymerase sigma-70 factor (ECF subfamily)
MEPLAECRPAVQALVARLLRRPKDDPDVEDCTHEALRRGLEGLGQLRDGEPLRPWLLGIARHVALDALRGEYRRRARHQDPLPALGDAPLVERAADPRPDPERALSSAERGRQLAVLLAALPDGEREALVLFHVEELDYRAIAERLGVPIGTVGTWLLRGRRALARALETGPGPAPRGRRDPS